MSVNIYDKPVEVQYTNFMPFDAMLRAGAYKQQQYDTAAQSMDDLDFKVDSISEHDAERQALLEKYNNAIEPIADSLLEQGDVQGATRAISKLKKEWEADDRRLQLTREIKQKEAYMKERQAAISAGTYANYLDPTAGYTGYTGEGDDREFQEFQFTGLGQRSEDRLTHAKEAMGDIAESGYMKDFESRDKDGNIIGWKKGEKGVKEERFSQLAVAKVSPFLNTLGGMDWQREYLYNNPDATQEELIADAARFIYMSNAEQVGIVDTDGSSFQYAPEWVGDRKEDEALGGKETYRPFTNTYSLPDLDISESTQFPDTYRMKTTNEEGQPNPGAIEYNLAVDKKQEEWKTAGGMIENYAKLPETIAKYGNVLHTIVKQFPRTPGESNKDYNKRVQARYDSAKDVMSTVEGWSTGLTPKQSKAMRVKTFGEGSGDNHIPGNAADKAFYLHNQDGSISEPMSYQVFAEQIGLTTQEADKQANIKTKEDPDNLFTPAGHGGSIYNSDGKLVNFTVADNSVEEQRKGDAAFRLSRPLYDLKMEESEPVQLPGTNKYLKTVPTDKWDSNGKYLPRKDNYTIFVSTDGVTWDETSIKLDQLQTYIKNTAK